MAIFGAELDELDLGVTAVLFSKCSLLQETKDELTGLISVDLVRSLALWKNPKFSNAPMYVIEQRMMKNIKKLMLLCKDVIQFNEI